MIIIYKKYDSSISQLENENIYKYKKFDENLSYFVNTIEGPAASKHNSGH